MRLDGMAQLCLVNFILTPLRINLSGVATFHFTRRMATEGNAWYESQQKRMGREAKLTEVLIVLASIVGLTNPPFIILAVVLLLVQHLRKSAVNTEQKVFAKHRLFITNPVLVLGSLTLVFYTLARGVQHMSPTTTLIGDVAAFSVLCIVLALAILFVEHYGNSQYFEWWSKRAQDRDPGEGNGLWTWVAIQFKQLSPIEESETEIKWSKKKSRARQRYLQKSFKPSAIEYNPPSFELSYFVTISREMLNWKRSLPIVTGAIFFGVHGFGAWFGLAWSVLVWFGSSLLADHIKYWYYFRPVQDGFFEAPAIETWKDRVVYEAQSYWTANLLAFIILWVMF